MKRYLLLIVFFLLCACIQVDDVYPCMQLGYSTYRTVLGYYSNDENALDMRKAMPRDVRKESIVPLSRPVRPEELEFD